MVERLLVQAIQDQLPTGVGVYHEYIPPGVGVPAVIYSMISASPIKALSGQADLHTSTWALTLYAEDSDDLASLESLMLDLAGEAAQEDDSHKLLWAWVEYSGQGSEPSKVQQIKGVRWSNLTLTLWYRVK
jgi:hypothetical protein